MYNIINQIISFFHTRTITKEQINNHCSNLGISRDQLTEFTIPDNVTSIGKLAFSECTSLQSIAIPNSVTTIDEGAFYECTALSSITIPDGVTSIGKQAFSHCTSLTSINIPDGVTEIAHLAFYKCTSLQSIDIPDSVTEIDYGAFYGCTSLTHVICNNPDLFTDFNIQNRNQIQFISTTEYFKDNYQELLTALESSGLNTDSLSNKELNLLMRLDQEDYLPKWKTLATTFNERSIDQIRSILHYFNKASCMPDTENSILLKKVGREPASINSLSMFLNPIDYTNLSMTASHVILKTKENDSAPFRSIQNPTSMLQ